MKKSLLTLIFAALAIAACSKEEPAPAPAPAPEAQQAPAPAAAPAAAPAPAPEAQQAPAAAPAPAADAKPAEAAVVLPAECEGYLTKVNACIQKIGAAGDSMKQAMEATRESWKQVPQDGLAQACKQATDLFEQQTGKALGC